MVSAKTSAAARRPVVDTWWQTETGGIMISPLPGCHRTKPGSATRPLPGISADVVDDEAQSVPNGGGGFLVLREPWPSMLRTIWGDDQRFLDTYWSRSARAGKGDDWIYFAGDGAKRDQDGDLWLLGRVDDVMLISGHNISTTEVESALVSHPKVAESAVVGATDPTTGQAIVAFVMLAWRQLRSPTRSPPNCAITWPRRSDRSPNRDRSCSCPNCPRPGPARSCGGCSGTSRNTGRWAM